MVPTSSFVSLEASDQVLHEFHLLFSEVLREFVLLLLFFLLLLSPLVPLLVLALSFSLALLLWVLYLSHTDRNLVHLVQDFPVAERYSKLSSDHQCQLLTHLYK